MADRAPSGGGGKASGGRKMPGLRLRFRNIFKLKAWGLMAKTGRMTKWRESILSRTARPMSAPSVLLSDQGERRNIWLDVVTAQADFEVDPHKFKER